MSKPLSFLLASLPVLALAAMAAAGAARLHGAGAPAPATSPGSGTPAAAPPSGRGPVVVELFTSQGCSSCPPADRLLSRLERDPQLAGRVAPLAFHVDYWNHLGWSDPFSSASWSQRQEGYAHAWRSNRIYTPQLVVDGRTECVGSQEKEVLGRIRRAMETEPAGRVTLSLAAPAGQAAPAIDGAAGAGAAGQAAGQAAGAPAAAAGQAAGGRASGAPLRVVVSAQLLRPAGGTGLDLWVALTESGLTTAVGAGENAAATLHDDHVVRRLVRAFTLPPTAGAAHTAEVDLPPLDRGVRGATYAVVAFLQNPATLAIEGAATEPLAVR